MYNIIMNLYELGVIIYSLFSEKVRKMWKGERSAVSILREKVDPNAKYIWFHAASLGEFEQGRPLIEQIRHDCLFTGDDLGNVGVIKRRGKHTQSFSI